MDFLKEFIVIAYLRRISLNYPTLKELTIMLTNNKRLIVVKTVLSE